MHIPDGFLTPEVVAVTDAAGYSVFLWAARKVSKTEDVERIPLMGLVGAFVFAVNMFSFPVPGGTSAHLTGAVFACFLLGPLEGYFVVSCALLLQALLFQHGGILTSGANMINIALTAFVFSVPARKLFYRSRAAGSIAAGMAAFAAVITGSVLCSLELALSGRAPLSTTLIAMVTANFVPAIMDGGVTLVLARSTARYFRSP